MAESTPAEPRPQDLAVKLSHDERAHGAFIVALKQKVNLVIAPRLEARYRRAIAPALSQAVGRPLDDHNKQDRKAVADALKGEPLYAAWALLGYLAQGEKWVLVEQALARDLPRLQAVADRLLTKPGRLCSLRLDPELALPPNIAQAEIHRQPHGFCFEAHASDVSAGARYNCGATMGPAAARARGGFRTGRSAGDFVAETIRARHPGFAPRRILELGCGTGRNTPSYKRQFPEATVVAVDCAAGLLRYACAFAESQGTAIEFRQMDVTRLEFPDASFDLVVSHILGHETTTRGLPLMIQEAWRVLAPGGVMFHADVATQPGHIDLFEQALNDWQVRYNGEPFWTGWATADVPGLMREAGIPADAAFVEYLSSPERGGAWFCYGARKPVAPRQQEAA